MPRAKKPTVTDMAEIETIVPQEVESNIVASVSTAENKNNLNNVKNKKKLTKDISPEIQEPVAEIPKKKFKQLHIEDTYWLENDIYQTMADRTDGKKVAKAAIINQALKDYFQKNNIELKLFKTKGKKD